MLSLAIVYRTPNGRPLSVATIENSEILGRVANEAIDEAYAKAAELSLRDPVLGQIQRREADKLKQILLSLVPDRSSRVVCLDSSAVQ